MIVGRLRGRLLLLLAIFGAVACPSRTRAQYIDTSSGCLQCHETGLRQNDFCPTIPAAVWAADDKHAKAFYLLHETDPARPDEGAAKRALVKQILGFELREAFTDERFSRLKDEKDTEIVRKVATVKACLRCHATWPKEADELFTREPPVSLELGVSCQACHGPGEKWDVPHRLVAWRVVTPEAKAGLGFADCRSPVAKARLCESCHVGSIAEGKFLKHEWYAAGHPPLPSFELASFQEQMPVHWKSLREKGNFVFRAEPPRDDSGQIPRQFETLKRNGVPAEAIKGSYLEANYPRILAKDIDPSSDLAAAKDAIIGGAVVFEMYVRQIAVHAVRDENDAAWPELALYDCAACHHELRRRMPGATNNRRHPPGRPPLADWPQVLAKLTALHAAGYDETELGKSWATIEEKLTALERATTGRPFGEAAAMQSAAIQLADSLSALAQRASETSFDQRGAALALLVLTDAEFNASHDFASARQAAWAIKAIADDLQLPGADQFFQTPLSDPLALRLPSGPQASVMENLRRWLPAAAQFDREWFLSELSRVRSATPKSGANLLPERR